MSMNQTFRLRQAGPADWPAIEALLQTNGLPLAGGVSNVNLNGSWASEYHPAPLLDYVRVSPSGPMMPLVFTPTTLGSRLNFGLTCRTSVVPPERAEEMSRMFIDRLMRVPLWIVVRMPTTLISTSQLSRYTPSATSASLIRQLWTRAAGRKRGCV